jgi:hypothetical protein
MNDFTPPAHMLDRTSDRMPDRTPEVPWPTHRNRAETPTPPGSDHVPQAAADSLDRVVQGAHDAVDRFAEVAAPKVRQLGESVSSAEAALGATAEHLGKTGDAWAEGLRHRVRGHPLTAVAAALALGVVIARVTR